MWKDLGIMEKIILSDLDGTITKNDTFLLAIFVFGSPFRIFTLCLSFLYLYPLYLTNIFDRNDMKEIVFKHIFKNYNLTNLAKKKEAFLSRVKYNTNVLAKIEDYKQKGYALYLVTASLNFYVELLKDTLGYKEVICTLPKSSSTILTGEFTEKKNCNFENKVIRIKELFNKNRKFYHFVAFGNSKGDYAMLKYADEYYYVFKDGKISKENMKLK